MNKYKEQFISTFDCWVDEYENNLKQEIVKFDNNNIVIYSKEMYNKEANKYWVESDIYLRINKV